MGWHESRLLPSSSGSGWVERGRAKRGGRELVTGRVWVWARSWGGAFPGTGGAVTNTRGRLTFVLFLENRLSVTKERLSMIAY